MQTTHKIPGASAARYANYLTSTSQRGDYYATEQGDAVPSRWHGSPQLLRRLGLSADRPVERADLRSVMHGFSPVDGEPLRPAGSDGTRVAGVELMFAPPKTVSALWAVSGPYRRAQIEAAHARAVASTLARMEREVALVRRRSGGVVRFERAGSLLGAEFVHTSSRLARVEAAGAVPDPQVHSHLVLFAAERTDGKLAAIESRQLYRSALENGAWYRAELAAYLQELGLPIERRTGKRPLLRDQGRPRAAGQPLVLSRRRRRPRRPDLPPALRPRAPRRGARLADGRHPRLEERCRRVNVNEAWRAVGEEHGLSPKRAEGLFEERSISNGSSVDLRAELLDEVTSERSMISTRELRAEVYELSVGVCRPTEADRLIEELARSGELVRLDDGMWTTRRLRELEQATIEIAERRATEKAATLSERSLKQARREVGKEIHGPLTQEQREALKTITGPGGLSVLVGRAGTGKGVVLSAAARAWQLEGYEVIGAAVAGATAQRLKDDAGLDRSHTADGLCNSVEKGRIHLDSKTVVIVDEAGMADTERLARLAKLTAQSRSKLVLAGDATQLSPIGAGGLFKELEGRVPTAELSEVHRAHHEWERRAWEQVRAGQPGPALASYRARDRLHIHDTRAQAAEAMVEGWDKARQKLADGRVVMITDASNKERNQINAMAQERRAAAGELGSHCVELPGKPYGLAAGDEVIFTAQFQIPGGRRVENGITGTVVDTSRRANKVTIRTNEREPREVKVDTAKFSDLSLGYAVHVHKGQGITAEASGVLMGGWQTDKERAYVALSRAREQTQIYVSREDLGEAGMDVGAIERLAERLRRSGAQEASVSREVDEREAERPAEIERRIEQKRDLDRGFGIE